MVGAAIGWYAFRIDPRDLLPVSHNTTQTRQYIIAVADKYWHDLDAVQAQSQLSSYEPVELTGMMAVILQESKSTETRTHVSALAQALDLIPPDAPFAALLAQPILLAALFASVLPLVIGFWLVMLPAWRERKMEQERIAEEAALGIPPAQARAGRRAREGSSIENLAGAEGANGDPGQDVLPGEENAQDEISPDTVIGGASDAGEPGTGGALPPLQPAVPEETEEDAEEKASAEKNILTDLANLFEEEDVSLSALEALVKNLPEVAVDELRTRATELVQQLKNFFRSRPSTRAPR